MKIRTLWLMAALLSGAMHALLLLWMNLEREPEVLSMPGSGGLVLELTQLQSPVLIALPEPEPVLEPEPEPEPEPVPESVPEPEPASRSQPAQSVNPEQQESTISQEGGSTNVPTDKGGNPQAQLDYQTELQLWLQRHIVYPRRLKRRKIEGDVLVAFTIDADGQLLAASLVQSSGVAELDEAALTLLERAVPFPPIPAEFGLAQYQIQVPVKYVLR